jgi:hypothetical protein
MPGDDCVAGCVFADIARSRFEEDAHPAQSNIRKTETGRHG